MKDETQRPVTQRGPRNTGVGSQGGAPYRLQCARPPPGAREEVTGRPSSGDQHSLHDAIISVWNFYCEKAPVFHNKWPDWFSDIFCFNLEETSVSSLLFANKESPNGKKWVKRDRTSVPAGSGDV